ncbi:YIP1 family protein [Natribaculum luteum]|uniref:YIP1 family protein n=1 Tax=Natribaculum luteum TaxID=1586232 RepID=A0ABD5P0J8_9EURY|nr:YIP1 family protein [Natribaculum luteum]
MARRIATTPKEAITEKLNDLWSVTGLVFDPESFLEQKINSARIRWEVFLIVLIGGLSLPGIYYVSSLAAPIIDSEEFSFVLAGTLLRPVVAVFLLWVGYSLAFHVLSNQFRGRGPPGRLLKGTAWALLPLGFGNLIKSVALIFVYSHIDIESAMVGRGAKEQLDALLNAGLREPVFVVAMLLFVACLLWSGYLMALVVQVGKDLDRRVALKIAMVPVAVHALYLVLGLIRGSVNIAMMI